MRLHQLPLIAAIAAIAVALAACSGGSTSTPTTAPSTAVTEDPPATGDAVAAESAVVVVDVDPPEHAASATAMAAMSGSWYRRMGSSWQGQTASAPSGADSRAVDEATRGARKRRSRRAFETTVTDDSAMAAAAKIGSSSQPVNG